jgi:predicted amidohydrolase YtcJ
MENQNQQAQAAQPLTPETALQNLAFAARQARLTYQEHSVIDASINVLVKLIQENASGPAPLAPEV